MNTQTPPQDMPLEAIAAELPTAEARAAAALDAYFLRPDADTYAAMSQTSARANALRREQNKRHFSLENISITELDGGRIAYSFTGNKNTLATLKEAADSFLDYDSEPERALYAPALLRF